MTLGEPERIQGDVRIEFRGSGRTRFRLQHARDCDGVPDALSWCDVSQVSNRNLPQAFAVGPDKLVRGVLVDQVDGDLDIDYRHHKAGWLRVLPLLDDDPEQIRQCKTYALRVVPLTGAQ